MFNMYYELVTGYNLPGNTFSFSEQNLYWDFDNIKYI